MWKPRSLMAIVIPVLLAVAGCRAEDPQEVVGDPGGMGAGRPDTTTFGTAAEDPSVDVLQGAGYGPTQDTVMPGERERLEVPEDDRR